MRQLYIVSSLAAIAASNLFSAQDMPENKDCCYYQGEMLTGACHSPQYSAPAKISLQDACCNKKCSDLFLDASFLYWYASQDGMVLGFSLDLQSTSRLSYNLGSSTLIQSFSYDPGFKVGIGYGLDEWELHAEYTWLRQKSTLSSDATTKNTKGGAYTPVWYVGTWYAQGVGQYGSGISATHVNSTWALDMDLIDLTIGRPYYNSRCITVSPFGGLRTAWIRQNLSINATVPAAAVFNNTLTRDPVYSHNRSNCWGIGPTAGAGCHWLVGQGFRVEGEGGLSVLFTQYTRLFHTEGTAESSDPLPAYKISMEDYNCLRTMANLGLGIGWGRYLNAGRYHLDFSADYEFNVFWNQNMMRTMIDQLIFEAGTSNDLYLHGLTFTGRFDF